MAELCRRNGIRRLSLFGSVLKGTGPDSDIDLLVEFEPGNAPSYFGLVEIETKLTDLLSGKRVDLRTPEELSRHFRGDVVREAELLYGSRCFADDSHYGSSSAGRAAEGIYR